MKTTDKIDAARIDLLLGELRLSGVKLVWTALAATADKEGWPAARFLAVLTEQEMVERGRRRFERHLGEARLPPGKTLDAFNFRRRRPGKGEAFTTKRGARRCEPPPSRNWDFPADADVIIPLLYLLRTEETSPAMASTSNQRFRALDLLRARSMLRLKDFVAAGIGPETLARLVREEAVVRPARGLYQLPDTQVDAAHTLAEAAVLVPKGVVCLTSALQYHELTLQMPSVVWMAIDRTAWRPKIDYPPIRFVRFTGPALIEGVERHRIESVEVPITNPARTIVDCFRYRTKVGLDVAMEGLREGLRRRRCTPDQLWHCARKARVWSIMRPYVEAMAADAA